MISTAIVRKGSRLQRRDEKIYTVVFAHECLYVRFSTFVKDKRSIDAYNIYMSIESFKQVLKYV